MNREKRRRWFLAAALAAGVVIAGCNSIPRQPVSEVSSISTDSVYDHDWVWQTDDGSPLRLTELRGRPQVVAMFFTSCTGSCGVTVGHMIQIEASLNARQRKDVGFVLVTFDGDNDTPKVLAKYRAERDLPPEWKIMRGSREATQELAAALGVGFGPDPARHIVHDAQITVLDAQGRIARRLRGVNANLAAGIDALAAQLGPDRPM
jgi:protein SCO1/2